MTDLTVLAQKQLAQLRPPNTAAMTAVSKPAKSTLLIKSIFVANTTNAVANVSIFLDQNGTTYNQTTALLYNVAVSAYSTVVLDYNHGGVPIGADKTAGSLGVQIDVANAITFSIFGQELR